MEPNTNRYYTDIQDEELLDSYAEISRAVNVRHKRKEITDLILSTLKYEILQRRLVSLSESE